MKALFSASIAAFLWLSCAAAAPIPALLLEAAAKTTPSKTDILQLECQGTG
jgi:hypothetical protein